MRNETSSHTTPTPTKACSVLVALATVVAVVLGTATPAAADAGSERVLVGLRQDVAAAAATVADDLADRYGARNHGTFEHAVRGAALEVPAAAVSALSRDPRVAWVEPDHLVQITGEIPTGVSRVAAVSGDPTTTGRVDADIAILDTGIDASHPDLDVAGAVDCTTGTCLRVDLAVDPHGHGTHVAGSAAAVADGRGVVGTAPGARLWSVRVLDESGAGRLSHIIAGIDWVTANAPTIEVANASLSCPCTSATMDAAIDRVIAAGVVMVAAAGNDSEDAAGHSPARHPSVMTVSAIVDHDGQPGGVATTRCGETTDDTFAGFSNFGDVVDIAAPGVCILSTVPGGYGRASGTSMAAPHVAGVAARYVVERTVARDATRAETVRSGLLNDWSVPQSSACGFTGGRSAERLLLLQPCAGDGPTSETPTDEPTTETPASDEPTQAPTHPPASTADPAQPAVSRVAGASRIGTSVALSREAFPNGTNAAVVAYANAFPDALAAAPLAAAAGAPVLLNDRDSLHPEIATELRRLGATTVYLMGGTSAQSATVERALVATGATVVRLAGPDRFATAAAAAEHTQRLHGDASSAGVVIALGVDFPDALAGGSLAAARRQPLLLTGRDQLPTSTRDTLQRLGVTTATIVGGELAVARSVADALTAAGVHVDRIAGTSRYDTAVRAAAAAVDAGASYATVVLASGRAFPDALSAAPLVATRGGVLLMSDPDALPTETHAALTTADVDTVVLAGGNAALSGAVAEAVLQAMQNRPEPSVHEDAV